jgi:hypothetical protein
MAQVVYISGSTAFTRTSVTDYEPSALTMDPLFTGPGNFRLKPSSPLIDAGNTALCPATDAVRFSRSTGARCDIGAFEFNPASQTPPVPQNLRIIR